MTIKGIKKIITKPHIFAKDYAKKRFSKDELKELVIKAIDIDVPSDKYYYFIYKELKKEGYLSRAEVVLRRAIEIKPSILYYLELVELVSKKKVWWEVIEIYDKIFELEPNLKEKYYQKYISVLKNMNRFNEICDILEPLSKKNKLNSDIWFIYGDALEKIGEIKKAEQAYKKAIELDKNKNSKELGIGIFYEKKGDWILANSKYKNYIQNNPLNEKLQYKFALSFDRCYKWAEAEEVYRDAITLKPSNIDWYYRLGFVQERQGKYLLASKSYKYAVENRDKHTPYWYYRLGYVLDKVENYKDACRAFLMMKEIDLDDDNNFLSEISNDIIKEESIEEFKAKYFEFIFNIEEKLNLDTTDTEFWTQIANGYKMIREYNSASNLYQKIIEKSDNFDTNLYFLLGETLTYQERFKEASKAFIEQRVMQNAHGMEEGIYYKDSALQKIVNYTEYYENYKLEDNVILYESFHGNSISCNPYAIFKSLLADNRFKDYKHIWVVNSRDKIPQNLKSNQNIIFVKRGSDLYMRYLAKAKYLINNVSFPEYFIRKDGQIYLNTWHGTPIKSLGKDIKDDFLAHKNVTRNFLQASHLIQPNPYTTDILLNRYDVGDIYKGVVAQTGYPRQDLMLNITQDKIDSLKESMGISLEKKVVLYAPTWRGLHGEAVFDTTQLKEDIKAINSLDNIHLVFKGHHMIESLIGDLDSVTIAPSNIDTNTLLSIVDILITDYSSIAFDYMALDRPIIYYTYDRDEYEEKRGLYFPIEELGGKIAINQKELVEALGEYISNPIVDKLQKEAKDRFCLYDDGNATKRVVDMLFFNKQDTLDIVPKSNKKSILIFGGPFIPNGITTSYVNLLNHIDTNKYAVTIAVEPNLMKKDSKKIEQFNRVENNINVIGRCGRMLMTLEEKWIVGKFGSQNILASEEMYNHYLKSHSREFRRMFGDGHFDILINFEGYNTFWTALFATKQKNIQKNAIYLHNDMYGEWKLRFPYLEKNFRLYKFYDTLAPVSKATMEHNIDNLSEPFELSKEQFVYCDNIQNPDNLLKKAQEPLEDSKDKEIFENTKVFINIARLSPEKDQIKLVEAFKEVVKKHPDSRLVNLGSGPLAQDIKHLIKRLNLEKNVFFLGQRSNPYPYLKKSDCFILSSNHEGQPMTLFEAMILDKPIIATNIVGNRSVLEGRYGLLVENSKEGLIQGMLDFLEGRYIENRKFDYKKYNQEAIDMFYSKVIGD